MKFIELPKEKQEELLAAQKELHKKHSNTAYRVALYNESGTRYICAHRVSLASQYMAFGGGSYWKISYGRVSFRRYKDPVGMTDYELANGQCYDKIGDYTIPKTVGTKKELMNVINEINARITNKFNL